MSAGRADIVVTGDRAAWNAYVESRAQASLYHRFEWLDVIERAFGHRARPLAAVWGGRIAGIFPLVMMKSRLFGRFAVSLPFLNYGGVLAESVEIERALWDRAVELSGEEGARWLEARHLAPHAFIEKRRHHKVALVLPLASSEDAQWSALRPTVRNRIRKAQNSGLSAAIGGADAAPAFYNVFARNMRDLGTPVYSRRFFDEILRAFPEAARVFTVWSAKSPVAAALALAHRDTLEVPWICSRRDALALCPNHCLYWEIIRHALRAGLRSVDFGRSSRDAGTHRFKEQWGADEVPLVWEYWTAPGEALPDFAPRSPRYATAVSLWKRLPLGVANALGPLIVRNIP